MSRSFVRKFFPLAAKVALLPALALLLWYELTVRAQTRQILVAFLQQWESAQAGWLLACIALMPLNWLAETQKWLPFVRRFEPMQLGKAFRAVLTGVAVSLFTPNRVGEFGGRILYLRPENRKNGIAATLVGNFAQMLVLMAGGLAGLCWLAGNIWQLDASWVALGVSGAIISTVAAIALYFQMAAASGYLQKIPLLRRIKCFAKVQQVLEQFSSRELLMTLAWSTLRYGIFATQYFLLLRFFSIETGLVQGFAGISGLFLLQMSLPLPPLSGLLARGNLAMLTWGIWGANELSSLAATFVLWIINLILPALVGTFSLFYVNTAKTFGHENDHL